MLARTNRLLTAADFRGVLRRGKRYPTNSMTVSILAMPESSPARFGFVVTKKVGNAVCRNLVRRRLKAAARELVDGGLVGVDVVARVLPASANFDWVSLRHDLVFSVEAVERR